MSNPITFDKEDDNTWPQDESYIWWQDGDDTWCKLYIRYCIDIDSVEPDDIEFISLEGYDYSDVYDGDTYYPCDAQGWIDAQKYLPVDKSQMLLMANSRVAMMGHCNKSQWFEGGGYKNSSIIKWQFLPETGEQVSNIHEKEPELEEKHFCKCGELATVVVGNDNHLCGKCVKDFDDWCKTKDDKEGNHE